ncbi:unnamed protein product [Trichogramma brassicae]|uniref:Reverse transcriptase domain-containing protein n=1 Tax=Trichogramma brassicae TaxID=86971 RepID=A0A6H5IXA3_9HYME|nr:unnamed protein product [Trichogramma brassicae]
MRTEIEEVKVSTEAIRSNTTLSCLNSHLVDSCEVLLSGIPTGVDLPKDVVLKKVLTAMGLNDFERFIVNSRDWVPKKRTNGTPEAFQAIVYRCSSPSNRDFLIMNAPKLASIHTNTLFGCGGDHKLVLRSLWPRETYSLLSKANIAAHKIGFARPVVRNLVVHMRKTTQLNASSNSLYIVPSEATNHTFMENRVAHTWIDLFLVNDSDSYSHYTKTNSPLFAGHDLIALKYRLPKPPNPLRTFASRHLESVDVDSLHQALRDSLDNTNVDPRIRRDPIDSGAASFSDGVIRAFDAVAPCRRVSTVRTRHKPWVSIDIRDLMRASATERIVERGVRGERRMRASEEAIAHIRRCWRSWMMFECRLRRERSRCWSCLTSPRHLTWCRIALCLHDLQVYYSFYPHDLEIGIHRLNRDIAAVAAWATGNGLSLNVRKTKAIILASDPYYRQLDLQRVPRVALNSVELPYSTEVQCLGLWIQTGLDWSRQVGSASGRIYGVLRVLRRLRRLLSRQNRKELIEALVFPHLDYACAAYDDLFDYQNIQLHRALNACVRFVFGTIGRRERVTPYRLGLGWLSVELRRRYFIASIAYSCLAQGTPSYLVKNFKLAAVNSGIERFSPRLPRRTLYYRSVDTAALQNSFTYTATDLINDLFPETILFDPRLISRTKQTIFSKLLAIDNDNSQIQI